MAGNTGIGVTLSGVLPHRESVLFTIRGLSLYNASTGRLAAHPNQAYAAMTHEFWLVLSARSNPQSVKLIFRHQCDFGHEELARVDADNLSIPAVRSRQQQYERVLKNFDDALKYVSNSLYGTVLTAKTRHLRRLSLSEATDHTQSRDEFEAAKELLRLQHRAVDLYWALTIKNAYLNWKYPNRAIYGIPVKE